MTLFRFPFLAASGTRDRPSHVYAFGLAREDLVPTFVDSFLVSKVEAYFERPKYGIVSYATVATALLRLNEVAAYAEAAITNKPILGIWCLAAVPQLTVPNDQIVSSIK